MPFALPVAMIALPPAHRPPPSRSTRRIRAISFVGAAVAAMLGSLSLPAMAVVQLWPLFLGKNTSWGWGGAIWNVVLYLMIASFLVLLSALNVAVWESVSFRRPDSRWRRRAFQISCALPVIIWIAIFAALSNAVPFVNSSLLPWLLIAQGLSLSLGVSTLLLRVRLLATATHWLGIGSAVLAGICAAPAATCFQLPDVVECLHGLGDAGWLTFFLTPVFCAIPVLLRRNERRTIRAAMATIPLRPVRLRTRCPCCGDPLDCDALATTCDGCGRELRIDVGVPVCKHAQPVVANLATCASCERKRGHRYVSS